MDKRYQVFVSSTYEDLQDERQEVMHALLELDCIPSGMELFPAANDDQWTVIKRVIEDCDYYIVIVGGRYGSVDKDGMSYTEKEYRYAMEIGKPVIGFLHKNPGDLPAKRTESAQDKKEKLEAFKQLVAQKMCQTWDSAADLGSKVSRSLIKLIKQNPAIGWIRADQLPSEDINRELLALRKKVEQLEKELSLVHTEAPEGAKNLAQGDDMFTCYFNLYDARHKERNDKIELTWNEIFYALSPNMIYETDSSTLKDSLASLIEKRIKQSSESRFKGNVGVSHFDGIENDTLHSILVQLKALGLITKSERNRSLRDVDKTYWKLTPYGEAVMTRLRAIPKPSG